MKHLHQIRSVVVWSVALLLSLLPIVVAADFGGILRWTHLVAGVAVLAITFLSLSAYWDQPNRGQLRQHVLLVPLMAWLVYAFFQTVPLPSGLVALLSPASYQAYTQWLQGILPAGDLPSYFAISVAPHDSRHAIAVMGLAVAVVFAAAMTFCTRQRIVLLLSVCSIGASLHVGYGILRLVFPGAALYDSAQDLAGGSFGVFINRNNAALFMNLGLGCSLGLLSWRLSALTGQELDDEQFEFNDLVSLIGDRDSMIGVFCSVTCLAGLLLCGSRGGIVAILFGVLLAFGWVRQRRGFATLPVVAVVAAVSAAILLLPLKLSMKSIERFEFFNAEAKTLANDGRLAHWPDGFATAVGHLPSGSGLSTYAFAHLPNQSGSFQAWAQHADNLWLELFVEQGVFGIIFVVAILLLVARSLFKLRESPDPIDQGLRTAGWYIIGTILLSQLFDFGLILPANLFFVAVVFPAIIARQVSMGSRVVAGEARRTEDAMSVETGEMTELDVPTGRKTPSLFASRKQTPIFVAVALVIMFVPVMAIPKLKRDADVDRLVRTTQYLLPSIRTDQDALNECVQTLESAMGQSADPHLLNTIADVKRSQARLMEVLEMRPKDPDEVASFFDKTKPVERQLHSLSVSPRVRDAYDSAISDYNRALALRPLDVDARSGKLYLDFLQDDPQQTLTAIDQLFTLHRNNPAVLVLLGEYAANRQQFDLAGRLWRTASSERNSLTVQTVKLSQRYDQVSLEDVIPSHPKSVRLASQQLLHAEGPQAMTYLQYSLEAVACDQCSSLEEKSACLSLQGDIAYRLGKFDYAFERYSAAIDSEPSNANSRLKLVRRLREQGRASQARKEARNGRDVLPGDKRFESLIKAIAQDDLRRANQN